MDKKIVIIGASSLIAQHCGRLWALNAGTKFILIGRNKEKLNRISADLIIRNPKCSVEVISHSLLNIHKIKQISSAVSQKFKPDLVFIAHGFMPNQKVCEFNIELINQAIEINAISPILWAESFLKGMQKRNRGIIAIISSVAGDRGRKSNYIYGAAKGFISRYIQGLQHRLHDSGVHIIDIKPGPTKTPMTFDMNIASYQLSPVENVAKVIVNGIKNKKNVIYAPKKWQFIMFIIKHIPRFIFNRLDF
jgi:decaprenylphospho-beta-D-erythro-pentofuranosid-2-ulose 2-reductase